MIDFDRYKVLTFDCYGTLIDWETGITNVVGPWLAEDNSQIPIELVISSFAIHQSKHQQTRPTLLYPEVMSRTWRDIENTFGWSERPERAEAFARSVSVWPTFPDTVESLKYLSQFYKLAILSNVDNASLRKSIALLEAPIAATVTAEDVESYKPGLPHFERAFEKLADMAIGREQILHVAQSKHHDIKPGRELGLTTVWVNRRYGKKGTGATLATDAEPDLTVNALAELVTLHKSQSRLKAAS
jgi:2-haloacid dehalogenase